jgi:HKD family nuclease
MVAGKRFTAGCCAVAVEGKALQVLKNNSFAHAQEFVQSVEFATPSSPRISFGLTRAYEKMI